MAKRLVLANYTFNATAKTVTFPGILNLDVGQILHVYNATSHDDLFLYGDATLSGTVAGNVLTLTASTTGMADTDKLLIIYDDNVQLASAQQLAELSDQNTLILGTMENIVLTLQQLIQYQLIPDANGRARVTFEAGTSLPVVSSVGTVSSVTGVASVSSVTTVATVSTLTNVANIGGIPAVGVATDLNNLTWAECVGSRIT